MLRFVIILLATAAIAYTSSAQVALADSIITQKKLKEIVYQLADDSLKGRYWDSDEGYKAAGIIANKMHKCGLQRLHGFDSYFQDIYFDEDRRAIRNVIGMLPGKLRKDEMVIFSAHYDHIGFGSTALPLDPARHDRQHNTDTIYNGANDDASGVAAILTLANYYCKKGPQERTIIFIAFSAEEIGLQGSNGITDSIKPKSVMAQFNLEMLGRRNANGQQPLVTGDGLSDMRLLLNECLKKTNGARDYFLPDSFKVEQLFFRSDNLALANLGVPAHTIMLTTGTDLLYHSPYDEPATLDYKAMTTIVRNIALATQSIISGKATPSRIIRVPNFEPIKRED